MENYRFIEEFVLLNVFRKINPHIFICGRSQANIEKYFQHRYNLLMGQSIAISNSIEESSFLLKTYTNIADLTANSLLHTAKALCDFFKEILVFFIKVPLNISDLVVNSSETHNGGKQVIIFSIDGMRFVYKPVNGDVHNFLYHSAVVIQRELNINSVIVQKPIFIHDKFSLFEYIHTSSAEISDQQCYFYKVGVLLALMHIFKVVDLHLENIIATKSGPVAIDLECAFYRIKSFDNLDIFDTGLIGDCKLSGIEGGGLLNKFEITMVSSNNKIRLDYQKKVILDDNRAFKTQYLEKIQGNSNNIIGGFEDCYDIVIKRKDDLIDLIPMFIKNSTKTRQVLRLTRFYTYLLSKVFLPNQREENIKDLFIKEKYFGLTEDVANAIFDYEMYDLSNGDIPYFYTKFVSKDIYHSDKVIYKNYFESSQKDYLKKIFSKINSEDRKVNCLMIKKYFSLL